MTGRGRSGGLIGRIPQHRRKDRAMTTPTTFFWRLRRWFSADSLEALDERTLRDIGLDRSEISSVEQEARHRAERSRVRIAA